MISLSVEGLTKMFARCLLAAVLMAAFPATNHADDVDVYLLSGQSNMQGSGSVKDFPSDIIGPVESVFFWTGKAFEPLVVGQTQTSSNAQRFGPEIGFALAIAKNEKPVYIVKYAASGMPLHHGWNAGNWAGPEPAPGRTNFYPGESADDPNAGKLYRNMVNRYLAALNSLRDAGHTPTVRGFAWMQGEADAKNQLSATMYGESLNRLRNRLAEVVGAESPLPTVFGQVLPYEPAMDRFTHRVEIRQAMANADQNSGHKAALPKVRMVSTDGYPLLKDTVHYNAEGLLKMGREFAAALQSVNSSAK